MKRSAGILLSISSLPSSYGIGCFSGEAYDFVDFLQKAGQSYWQILPLGPTGYGDSPYQSFSTYAGNPYFISLDALVEEGLLTREECEQAFPSPPNAEATAVDYEMLYRRRFSLLRKAFVRSNPSRDPDFQAFCQKESWLEDYALFMALKDKYQGKPWSEWDKNVMLRQPEALQMARLELDEEITFHQFMQYHFYKQWNALKHYANERGIQIIGDIPIYVAFDSADTWANPELFQLDSTNTPIAVAGCPPDGFSAEGQLWGNPLYDWPKHRDTGFHFWISRLKHCFSLYDVVRIDHFRGFDEYFSIPYPACDARKGHWEKGPGMELFDAIQKALGQKEIIAEDLGFLTDNVRRLVQETGYPGMKVLEFAFDARDTGSRNDYLPHNYPIHCVAYTGTHDNQTLRSWFDTITPEEQCLARIYLADFFTPKEQLPYALISLLLRSPAMLCIIPLQDYLGLDDSARMNEPGTLGKNWKWRMEPEALTPELAERIQGMCERYGRGK